MGIVGGSHPRTGSLRGPSPPPRTMATELAETSRTTYDLYSCLGGRTAPTKFFSIHQSCPKLCEAVCPLNGNDGKFCSRNGRKLSNYHQSVSQSVLAPTVRPSKSKVITADENTLATFCWAQNDWWPGTWNMNSQFSGTQFSPQVRKSGELVRRSPASGGFWELPGPEVTRMTRRWVYRFQLVQRWNNGKML